MPLPSLRPTLAFPLGVLLALAGCDREHPLRRVEAGEAQVTGHGTLIIAIDALRWDRTSLGRADRDTTPNLTKLAAKGVSFDDTWTPQPSRFDAHVGLLTGCDPLIARRPPFVGKSEGGAVSLPRVVPPAAPSVAVSFLAGGHTTAAFVDDPNLTKARGFDRGFREYTEYAGRGTDRFPTFDGTLAVGARFIQWLNARDLDEDWFAYVHLADLSRCWRGDPIEGPDSWTTESRDERRIPAAQRPHLFHLIPPENAREGSASVAELERRYDAALLALDRGLGRIFAHVDEYGRDQTISIVVLGTYGMPFGEGGIYTTPSLPDGPDARVPWIVRPAGDLGLPVGRHLGRVASLLDIGPTMLDLAGLPVPAGMHGLSRAAELRDAEVPPRRRYAFLRAYFGGAAVITDERHWGIVSAAAASRETRESWLGRSEVPVHSRIMRSIVRSGANAVESLRFDLLGAPEGGGDAVDRKLGARYSEWARSVALTRDALQFGRIGAAGGEEPSLDELAERLRGLQTGDE